MDMAIGFAFDYCMMLLLCPFINFLKILYIVAARESLLLTGRLQTSLVPSFQ
jgi:hypothetical protein